MPRVCLLLLLLPALGGCVEPSSVTYSESDFEFSEGASLGEPCFDRTDCSDGLYCVATPCDDNASGAGEPVVPPEGCGVFTCQLICASEGHLQCADGFSCCSSELECNSRSQCVEPG